MIRYKRIRDEIDAFREHRLFYPVFGEYLEKLVSDERMDYVWRQMDKTNINIHKFVMVIVEASEWPKTKTDKLSPAELEKWNGQVNELALKLADLLEDSRLNRLIFDRMYAWVDDVRPHLNFTSIQEELILDETAVDFTSILRELASAKEKDQPEPVDGYPSVMRPIKHSDPASVKQIFAGRMTDYFLHHTKQKKREMVAILVGVFFECPTPDLRQIRRWAP